MRLIIAGGRHLDDVTLIRGALARAHANQPITVLIHGGSGFLGISAEDWAREQRLHVVRYPANWREFGKRAEAIRNAFMLEDSRPDMVMVLPGGTDTADLTARAVRARVSVINSEGTDQQAHHVDRLGFARACPLSTLKALPSDPMRKMTQSPTRPWSAPSDPKTL